MSCDWPFVYFPGGFISLLFGDYTNIHMKISVYTPLTVENISSWRNSFGLGSIFVNKMNTYL